MSPFFTQKSKPTTQICHVARGTERKQTVRRRRILTAQSTSTEGIQRRWVGE